jgi:Ca2+-binding EF-hand superfamily protein
LLKRLVSIEEDTDNSTDHGIDLELENKVRTCFKRLESTLQKKNLNLYKVFVAYDGDKSGQLSIDEFSKIMKRLDSSFVDSEIETIFDVIDQDKSKTVEFE